MMVLAVVVLSLLPLSSSSPSLHLTSLEVPSWGEEGSTVSMCCSYSLPSSLHHEVDVKWYHNTQVAPFLVWLPGIQTNPQVRYFSYIHD